MKKIMTMALLALFTLGAQAQDSAEKNKPVFTTIKEHKITSIKDQNRSGTCWAYSTLSFFESEILKATGKTYDLCEMFGRARYHQALRYLPRERHASARHPAGRLAGQLQ